MSVNRATSTLGLLAGVLLLAGSSSVAVGSPASTSDTNDGVPATGVPTKGDVFLKSDEALKLAFPKAEVTKERTFLNKDQKARVAKLAGEDFDRAIINAYVARDDKGVLLGTAYFDNHKVRTKRETLMFVVDRAGKLTRIEVLAFGEPKEYMPSARWFAQLIGKSLTKGLSIKRDIKNLSGATLSAKATVAAARRVLATHQMLGELRLKRAEEAARKEALDKGKKDDDPATDPPKESPPNPEDPMPDVPTPKPKPTPPEDGEDPDGGGGAPGPTGIPYLSRSER